MMQTCKSDSPVDTTTTSSFGIYLSETTEGSRIPGPPTSATFPKRTERVANTETEDTAQSPVRPLTVHRSSAVSLPMPALCEKVRQTRSGKRLASQIATPKVPAPPVKKQKTSAGSQCSPTNGEDASQAQTKPSLGCSKCGFARNGCKTCRLKAAAQTQQEAARHSAVDAIQQQATTLRRSARSSRASADVPLNPAETDNAKPSNAAARTTRASPRAVKKPTPSSSPSSRGPSKKVVPGAETGRARSGSDEASMSVDASQGNEDAKQTPETKATNTMTVAVAAAATRSNGLRRRRIRGMDTCHTQAAVPIKNGSMGEGGEGDLIHAVKEPCRACCRSQERRDAGSQPAEAQRRVSRAAAAKEASLASPHHQQKAKEEAANVVVSENAKEAAKKTVSSPKLSKLPQKSSPLQATTTAAIEKPSSQRELASINLPSQPQPDSLQGEQHSQGEWWNAADASKVAAVKAALHVNAATVGNVPLCRERQVNRIDGWLAGRLKSAQGGSMYLSGLPGTGKSLTALEIVRQCGRHATDATSKCSLPPALLAINCMRLTHPTHVIERILAGIRTACRTPASNVAAAGGNGKGETNDPIVVHVPAELDEFVGGAPGSQGERRASGVGARMEDALQALRKVALKPLPVNVAPTQPPLDGNGDDGEPRRAPLPSTASASKAARRSSLKGRKSLGADDRGMIVVVLDELDGLLTGRLGEELVGGLFALASQPKSRLILIGIANSIDLVQRLLRPGGPFHLYNLCPEHEIFPAYLRSEVSRLLQERLSTLPGQVFEANAIEFCARKVANGSGDLRRALEAASKAVDVLIQEQLADDENKASGADTVAINASQTSRRVGMRHMATALARVTGGIGAGNDNVAAIKKLPPPQQLLICIAAKLLGETLQNRGLAIKVDVPKTGPNSVMHKTHFIGSGDGRFVSDLLPIEKTHNRGGGASTLADAHRRRRSSVSGGGATGSKGRFESRPGELTLADLEGTHATLCKQVGVTVYNGSEFTTAAEMLATLGLVEFIGSGDMRRRRVALRISEDDVLMALADIPVLKGLVGA